MFLLRRNMIFAIYSVHWDRLLLWYLFSIHELNGSVYWWKQLIMKNACVLQFHMCHHWMPTTSEWVEIVEKKKTRETHNQVAMRIQFIIVFIFWWNFMQANHTSHTHISLSLRIHALRLEIHFIYWNLIFYYKSIWMLFRKVIEYKRPNKWKIYALAIQSQRDRKTWFILYYEGIRKIFLSRSKWIPVPRKFNNIIDENSVIDQKVLVCETKRRIHNKQRWMLNRRAVWANRSCMYAPVFEIRNGYSRVPPLQIASGKQLGGAQIITIQRRD